MEPITGFAFDSRLVKKGDCFVALKGAGRDGHEFLQAARDKGAVAAIVRKAQNIEGLSQLIVDDVLESFQLIASAHRERFLKPVIGITGSAGKTSTKDLLKHLLGDSAYATRGNLNNHIGVPMSLLEIDPVAHSAAVIEAGTSAPGEIAPLARMIDPSVSIVTLVAPAHLQRLKDLETVAREKAALLENTRRGGMGFVPVSVMKHAAFQKQFPCALTVLCREKPHEIHMYGAHACFYQTRLENGKLCLQLWENGGTHTDFFMRPVSPGVAANAALAISAARYLGRSDEQIKSALENWSASAMRGELREFGGSVYYLDYYNSNPASLMDALEAFQFLASENLPRLYVIGSMGELGEDAALWHERAVEKLCLRSQDLALTVGEHAAAICQGLLKAGNPPSRMIAAASLAEARTVVDAFKGALFFKGSRTVALEKLLPEELLENTAH